LLLALVSAGCGKPGPVKVRGTVTLDGNPLPGATVTFVPRHGGRPASAVTLADGTFKLTTFNTGDGALPGEYKVTVRFEKGANLLGGKRDPKQLDTQESTAFFSRHSPEGKAKAAAARKKAPRSAVPAIYGDKDRTPLQYVVPTDGPLQLELVSNVR
jgi:hypothetical protein